MPAQRRIGSLAVVGLALLAGCTEEKPQSPTVPPVAAEPAPAEPSAPAIDGFEELGALWKRIAADPAAATPADGERVCELLRAHVLPPIEGAQWTVESVVASSTSDFHAVLSKDARQLMTLELRNRGEVTVAERNSFGDQAFQGFPCSRRARFLFVLVGSVELRAEGVDPAYRSADSLEPVLARFPLDRLARL